MKDPAGHLSDGLRTEPLERVEQSCAHLPGFLFQYRVRPDGSAHFPFATGGIREIFGCDAQDVAADDAAVSQLRHPDDAPRVDRLIEESRRTLQPWRLRYRVCHPKRGVIWVESVAGPERRADGSTVWHGVLRDVTAEQARDERLQLLGAVFHSGQQGVIITDPESRIVEVNESFQRITGFTRDEVVGRRPSMLSSGRHGKDFYRSLWTEVAATGRWRGEIWNRRKGGELIAELMSIDAIRDANGAVTHYVAVFSDISLIKAHQSELERIAHYDALTGLPNRRLLGERLEALVERSRDEPLAVCYLDLDGFKAVNDAWGHPAGDELLKVVAQRLGGVLGPADTVARVGGDEFVLLLVGLRTPQQLQDALERVLAAVRRPVTVPLGTATVSASIGVAVHPDVRMAHELLRCADQAMYGAKQQGRNCYVFFDAAETGAQLTRQTQLRDIELALDHGELELFFQPKIDLRSGRVLSAEALIRWRRPDGSLRSPAEFLPVMAGHPLEVRVGNWVIETAMRLQDEWAGAGVRLGVSVNVGVDHLLDPEFVPRLSACLAASSRKDPGSFVLEILETSHIEDFRRVRERVLEVSGLGVMCSLDDFGTGYSSMTHLRQLPVDEVKIDQSFVRGMLQNADDENIVKGIVGLAHAFERIVVAEGAETPAHVERLRELGCDQAQGYAIARPMPARQLPDWVRERATPGDAAEDQAVGVA